MIDTAQKRNSAFIDSSMLPFPDGTINTGDRETFLGFYSGIGAVSGIQITPFAPVVATSSVTHFIASLKAAWVLTGAGSLVVSADKFSADYTAPGSPTVVTITVTDLGDPSDHITTPVTVTSFGPITQGDVSDMNAGMNPVFAGRSVVDIGRH